ncbi:PREDICTED: sperm flagellar protein 1-like [Chrysochloris asiatica]|uniref:Sperm flagellar protein 1-like n=1 Tax=Chrysochloris asiatica TaxID=185453 RepID=A0A9B0TTT0_CHRAS|nr:PREDICTED: sperm flagellar protein 1-like [Chrysochloris asiatica]
MLGATHPSPPTVQSLPPSTLSGLYAWLDRLPLSRPKRHLARDFSDGVMLAEIVKYFHPQLVDLHNYIPTCNTDQKLSNWSTLNRKVFHKLNFCVSEADIRKVVANTSGAVEPILCALRAKVEAGARNRSPPSEAGPGTCGLGASGLWAELAGQRCAAGIVPEESHGRHAHSSPPGLRGTNSIGMWSGPASPPVLRGGKTSPSQWPLEEMGCARQGWDMVGQPWEPLSPGAQQLLEDKEHALVILQETVQVGSPSSTCQQGEGPVQVKKKVQALRDGSYPE